MKSKLGIIAVAVCFVSTIASASLYSFTEAGYSADNQQNWGDLTAGGTLTGSASFGGNYPGMSPWFAGLTSDEGGATFTKSSGSGYIATAGTYSPGIGNGVGGSFTISSSGSTGNGTVVLVVEGGGSEYAALLTDANGAVRGGAKTALSETFAGIGPGGVATYNRVNAYQFATAGLDLSSYDVGFTVAPHGSITGLQLEESANYVAIPEPATMGLMGLTAGGLFVLRRFRA